MSISFGVAQAKTWRIAGPIMLSNLTVPLVGIVDAAVIGHLPDHQLLAAVNLGAASISMLYFMFGFLRMGTSGLVAQAYGAGDHHNLQTIFRRALGLALFLGLLLTLLQTPIAIVSSSFANAADYAQSLDDYLSYRLSAAPFALMATVTTAVLVAVERAGTAVAIQIFANLLNMTLDYVFVYQLHMDVAGVAMASAIAETSACLLGLFALRHLLRANKRTAGPSGIGWLKIMTVNRDIFVRSTLLVCVFYSLTAISGQYGSLALAACGVLLNLFYLCSYGLDGFAHAAEVLTGHAYGARSASDLRQYVRAATLWSVIFAVAMGLALWIFGASLIALQTNIPEVQSVAAEYLPWFALMPLFGVAAFLMDGIFIGTTHSVEMRNSMLLSTLVYLLGLSALTLWGLHGLWLAFSTFMIARGVILTLFYPRIERGLRSA